VRQFDYLVQALRRAGPRKLLFGSDGPWIHPGLELHKIRLLGLPAEQERLVLGGNVLRLLHRARVAKAAAPVVRSVEVKANEAVGESDRASQLTAADLNEYRL
jgi:hypothetical protein